ncbi:MAG: DUF6442 family protein [Oscillospiraceae bacterium]|nr:DUF6442 family protein [Oscillospiraceae bacterium]
MKKNEILEKSRKAKKDEGAEHAQTKGTKLGYILFLIMTNLIATYAVYIGDMALMFSQGAVMMMFGVGVSIEQYRFTKSKWFILLAVGMAAFAVYAVYEVVSLTWGGRT